MSITNHSPTRLRKYPLELESRSKMRREVAPRKLPGDLEKTFKPLLSLTFPTPLSVSFSPNNPSITQDCLTKVISQKLNACLLHLNRHAEPSCTLDPKRYNALASSLLQEQKLTLFMDKLIDEEIDPNKFKQQISTIDELVRRIFINYHKQSKPEEASNCCKENIKSQNSTPAHLNKKIEEAFERKEKCVACKYQIIKNLAESKYQQIWKNHYESVISNLTPSIDKEFWSYHLRRIILNFRDSENGTIKNLEKLYIISKALSSAQVDEILAISKFNPKIRGMLPYILTSLKYETLQGTLPSLTVDHESLKEINSYLLESIKNHPEAKKWVENQCNSLLRPLINKFAIAKENMTLEVESLYEDFEKRYAHKIKRKHLKNIDIALDKISMQIKNLTTLQKLFDEIFGTPEFLNKTSEILAFYQENSTRLLKLIHEKAFQDALDDDPIFEAFGIFNLTAPSELRNSGLLYELSNDEFENSKENLTLLNKIALKRLIDLKLETIGDLKRLQIYNAALLQEYLEAKTLDKLTN